MRLVRLDPTTAELVLAGVAMTFGVAMLAVSDDLIVRSLTFRKLDDLAPLEAWSILWIVGGIAQAVGALSGWWRRQVDVALACLWVFWASLQAIYLGASVGPLLFGWCAIAALIASHLDRQGDAG